jgi:DNA-binding NtrC family response regulator
VVKIDVPPLRKRPEDIVPIAERLLAMHADRLGRVARLTPEAADRLAAHPFPGNVRELDNELLRALALSEGQEIKPRHLSAAIQGRSEPRRRGADGGEAGLETLESAFARVEKDLLIRHLKASNGRKVGAARSLGLSRPGLDAKLARHGIDVKELARSLKERPR